MLYDDNIAALWTFMRPNGRPSLTPGRILALKHEPALRADRHDEHVLDHLGIHEAEDFGSEVLGPVGPA